MRNIELVGTDTGRPKVDCVLCLKAFWVRITSMYGKAKFGTAYKYNFDEVEFCKASCGSEAKCVVYEMQCNARQEKLPTMLSLAMLNIAELLCRR